MRLLTDHPFAGIYVVLRATTVALAVAALLGAVPRSLAATSGGKVLRVCSDPDNMPFSNRAGAGFENKLAEMVGHALGERVAYHWAPQNRNFLKDTLLGHACDVVMGIPSETPGIATTQPYYWSSYVFVSRRNRHFDFGTAKARVLKHLRIGVEVLSRQLFATPPAQILAEHGVTGNVIGYRVRDGSGLPDSQLMNAVEQGQIDIAALWGPRAGYLAKFSKVPLRLVPMGDNDDFSAHKKQFSLLSLQYDIAMAVRTSDRTLLASLNKVIAQNLPEIRALLKSYGVPLQSPLHLASLMRPY